MIVQLRLAGFGLSIITRSPRIGPHELIYMKLQTIAIEYACSMLTFVSFDVLSYHTNDCEQSLELLVDRMQIDNGLYNTPYPIMLYPVLPPNMKVLQLALVHSKEWKTITFIRCVVNVTCEMF